MESKKVIKFFSYTKKILAMSFFSLILSISLSNKNLFAIDKVNLTGNGTTYKSDDKSKVSYELSADKTFSALVGDEGAEVYSKASYKDSDGKDAEASVTSISAASGVSSFTVKLVDPKNDRIKINPSEDSDLEIKLDYDGNLSQAETRKIFGNDVDVGMNQGKADKLTIKKPVSPEDSSELYDYGYGSDEGYIESTDKTNSNNEKSSSNASSSSSNTNSSSASSSSNTTTSGYTTSAGTNSSTSKTTSSSSSTQTTGASNSSSTKSSNASKSSSYATKSASTKTSDASLIPLSILACSGASVLFFKKKD